MNRITELREKHGWTMTELAVKSFCSYNTIRLAELGQGPSGKHTRAGIAAALMVTVDYLWPPVVQPQPTEANGKPHTESLFVNIMLTPDMVAALRVVLQQVDKATKPPEVPVTLGTDMRATA